MNRHIHLVVIISALAVLTAGCKGSTQPDFSPVTIRMAVNSAGTLPHMINKMAVTVTGPDLTGKTEYFDVSPSETSLTGTVVVPNGRARLFEVEVTDSLGTVLYQGSAGPRDLVGRPVSLDVALQGVIFAGTKQHGAATNDESNGIALDAAGNLYVVGTKYDVAASSSQAVLTKFDRFGITAWPQPQIVSGPSGSLTGGSGVAVDSSGNILVTGYTNTAVGQDASAGGVDCFIAKYDPAGTQLWLRQFGSSGDDFSTAIAVDGYGNAFVTGYTDGGLDGIANAGGFDAFIVKYDSAGNRILAQTRMLGTPGDDYGEGIATDGSGNYSIAGSTTGVLAGVNAGLLDMFVARYDTSGTMLWVRQRGTVDDDEVWGLAVDSPGNIHVAGWTFSNMDGNTNQDVSGNTGDIFLMKFDSQGNRLWTKELGTVDNDIANSLAVDTSGNIYVTGGTRGSLDQGIANRGLYDMFLLKCDSAGTLQWIHQRGTAARDEGMAIALDASGNPLVTGYTYGGLDQNNNADSTGNTGDFFLMKFDQTGEKQ